MPAQREIEVEATPEEVWEALTTEEGRERWLEETRPRDPRRVGRRASPAGLVVVERRRAGDAGRVPRRRGAGGARVVVTETAPTFPLAALARLRAGVRLSDAIGPVFAALADPTRRHMVETLLREARRPSRRSRADAADHAPGGRQAPRHARATPGWSSARPGPAGEVRYRLRPGALAPAATWLRETAAAWDERPPAPQGRRRARGGRPALGRLQRASPAIGPAAPRPRPRAQEGALGAGAVGVVVVAGHQDGDLLGGQAVREAVQQRSRPVGRRLAPEAGSRFATRTS